ncbi:MAG: hypothetical protein AAF391_12225 [Bacteroidota bacterium]
MKERITCCFLVLLGVVGSCFGRDRLELEIRFQQDTFHHLQSIRYQIVWHNRSKDTIKIRDDQEILRRPGLVARTSDDRSWSPLWKSNKGLHLSCFFDPIAGHPFGYRIVRYFTVPPRESVIIEASYFPIQEDVGSTGLMPGRSYEFKFDIPEALEAQRIKIRQRTDKIYIDYASPENEAMIAKMIQEQINPYELFKSWEHCIVDSNTVSAITDLGELYPGSDLTKLIQLKRTEWDWRKGNAEEFGMKYTKGLLMAQLNAIKDLARRDFYDKVILSAMIYRNLDWGLSNGYSMEEYFNNLEFADSLLK